MNVVPLDQNRSCSLVFCRGRPGEDVLWVGRTWDDPVALQIGFCHLGWALFDRRRKIKEATKAAAVARFEYIREHYADLLDLKQRMAQKLQLSSVQMERRIGRR
jgi:hypothetical protein